MADVWLDVPLFHFEVNGVVGFDSPFEHQLGEWVDHVGLDQSL